MDEEGVVCGQGGMETPGAKQQRKSPSYVRVGSHQSNQIAGCSARVSLPLNK